MIIEKLTESEELIMRAVWDCRKEPGLRDIFIRVTDVYQKNWKSQTVSTFLAKLCQKKYLKLQRNGKEYTYKILVSEDVYNRTRLQQLYFFLYQQNETQIKRDLEELLTESA